MSRLQVFPLPDVGEGLTEADILEWKVGVGDDVTVNQVIVEIETAKAAVELPSPWAGRVHQLLAEPGVTIAVGTPIIAIDTDPGAGPLPGDDPAADGAAPQGAAGAPNAGAPDAAAAVPAGASAAAPAAGGPDANRQDEESQGGAKIGEVAADGRIATLVGYIPAAGSGRRRPRKGHGAGGAAAAAAPAPTSSVNLAFVGASAPVLEDVRSTAAHGEPGHELASRQATSAGAVGAAGPGGAAGADGAEGADGAAGTAGRRSQAPLSTPPVRKLAKDLGVDLAELAGSGAGGVVTRADVEAAAGAASSGAASSGAGSSGTASSSPAGLAGAVSAGMPPGAAAAGERERRVPVKGVRKMTAQAMVASAFTAPHVTEFLTVDVTEMMRLREKLKSRRDFAGVKVTPLTFAARAVCIAAQRTPEVNSVWDEASGEIVFKNYVNLGIAAATPRGLVVPNVPEAQRMSLLELATAVGELTDIARQGRTSPAAMAGGTFTITNVGVFGVDTGTPIINPGESAILALGSIKDAPWVVDGQLAVRKVCQLALSFDHRVIDGQQGSEFLADVGALLSDPGLAMVF
ncbi:dihydrolipoamide acetyltransferase family protein [Nakamurella aerolata]|uniref:dihydrolipoamide acetyltransferase family protein n=1 Tax=Nakamurella aerolata TaxID=1656892 RepID=UPI003CCE1496